MAKYCTICGKRAYSDYCVTHKPRKPITQRGKRTIEYETWRDTIARPFLDSLGRQCAICGSINNLQIDHILNRGSRPDLKMSLSNVQYLCDGPPNWCHTKKTNHQLKEE